MPIPKIGKKEDKQKFVSRCMGDEVMKKEYPNNQQRIAICLGQTKGTNLLDKVLSVLGFTYSSCCDEDGSVEELTPENLIIPSQADYIGCDEDTEEYDLTSFAKYQYQDPKTYEIYYFNKIGNYKKDNRYLVYKGTSSEYQGRKVNLNKPFRTPDGPKKFSVYVKNEKGNVVKVNFGDPNMKIKKNIPERRKSFRARHNCDNPGPKWKARYWSCKAW